MSRAAPGQRHLRGRGDARDARAARRQAAGAGQRRLWQAHGQDLRLSPAALTPFEWPEDQAERSAALDRALAGDPAISHVAAVQCETTSGILNPIAEVAEVVARRRPAAPDRCHERLRRAAAGCPRDAVRWARRLRQQMPGGRARARLRDRRRERSRRPRARRLRSPSICTISGRHGADRPVALHAADPRARRLRSGARASTRPRAVAGRGARYRKTAAPGRGHARAGLRDPAAGRAPGADHRHLPDARRSALRLRGFYDRLRGAATSSIRAS